MVNLKVTRSQIEKAIECNVPFVLKMADRRQWRARELNNQHQEGKTATADNPLRISQMNESGNGKIVLIYPRRSANGRTRPVTSCAKEAFLTRGSPEHGDIRLRLLRRDRQRRSYNKNIDAGMWLQPDPLPAYSGMAYVTHVAATNNRYCKFRDCRISA